MSTLFTNIAIGISITLNVIFLVMVVLVLSGRAMKYLMKFFVKPTYERWVSQFELLGIQPGDTVFLGDSITEGGNWHELFPQSDVRNRGIGGDVTTGVLARLDQVADGRPAQVFLMIGTNDLTTRVSQEEIVANIVMIVERIHAASPQTQMFVQSVLPRSESYKERIESLNTALKIAINGKATWVDLYPLFLNKAGRAIDASFSNDKLHLTGKAYLVWKDAIAQLVNLRPAEGLNSRRALNETTEAQKNNVALGSKPKQ